MEYRVELEMFRGPLDLLLYLVKREEVDICDIPIARIAEQFLEHLRVLQTIDVERAGDFLVMAATLMEIKSRMLLPRPESAIEDDDDPRRELVRQLMEYRKYKDAAALLEAQSEQQQYRFSRQTVELPAGEDPSKQPLHQVEVWDLVSAFGRLMRETLALQPQQITADSTPIHVHMENILQKLRAELRIPFSALFTPPHTRGRLVGLFLAILELTRSRLALAHQEANYAEIWIELASPESGTESASAEATPAAPS